MPELTGNINLTGQICLLINGKKNTDGGLDEKD